MRRIRSVESAIADIAAQEAREAEYADDCERERLRDQFACAAIGCFRIAIDEPGGIEQAAKETYMIADAMLKAREVKS